MRFKNLFFTCMAILLFQTNIFAKIEAADITKSLENAINKTTTLLKNSKNKEAEAKNIYAIIDPMFDYALMAKLSLGSKAFKKLSPTEQKTFAQKFEKRLKDSFISKLKLYSNQVIEVGKLKDVKSRKIVQTALINDGKKFEIDYKFYDAKEKGWLIYDIDILNISVVQSYRNQFANILDDKSFQELLLMLKNTEPATAKK